MQLQHGYLISQKLCRALTSLIAIMYCNLVIKMIKIILINYPLWETNNWTRASFNYTLGAMSLQDNLLYLLDWPILLHSLARNLCNSLIFKCWKNKPPKAYDNLRDDHIPRIFKTIKNPKQTKMQEQNSTLCLPFFES